MEQERWRRHRISSGPGELGEFIRRWALRCEIECENLDTLDDYQVGRMALTSILPLTEEDVDEEVRSVLADREESPLPQTPPELLPSGDDLDSSDE